MDSASPRKQLDEPFATFGMNKAGTTSVADEIGVLERSDPSVLRRVIPTLGGISQTSTMTENVQPIGSPCLLKLARDSNIEFSAGKELFPHLSTFADVGYGTI